jgi:hypothetical protein
MMRRLCLGLAFGVTPVLGMGACGGEEGGAPPADASADVTAADGTSGQDGSSEEASDAAPPPDAGPPCAPPTDPTKSALCLVFAPEAITFLADPSFDGKGFMGIDVHDAPNPDAPDGAPLPSLQNTVLPGPDAGELDLSSPVPIVRFDGLPATTVYPRAIFVDSRGATKPAPGWWLGGYDLSKGIAGTALLNPVALTAGEGKTVTIDLVALRRLSVTLSRTATPIGNAMGPAAIAAMPDQVPAKGEPIFGFGTNPCASVAGASTATVEGFVYGKGPYFVLAQVDDFADGGLLPPGALTSLALGDAGGVVNPPSSQITYDPKAYGIDHAVTLDLVIPRPDAGPDTVACP